MGLAALILAGCEVKHGPKYTVNDPKDPNTTWRVDQPLDYQAAMRNGHCPISLPPEARNIQFVDFYAGWGGFSKCVRFEAPVEVCRERARAVIADHNSKHAREADKLPTTPSPLAGTLGESLRRNASLGEPVSQAPWFDSNAIQRGEVWGEDRSRAPIMLIDLDRGVFYYQIAD